MTPAQNIQVNRERLWQSLMEMAKIGATAKGGSKRLALSDLDREGRDLFVGWCKEAGCTVSVDRMGNIFARRPGRRRDLAPVVTGSHLDTQPTGGKFDGVYGVLAGLEVIRTLNDLGYETDAPLEVAVWTNEEGSRFAPAMVGSGVFAGVFTEEYGHSRTDLDGKRLGDELKRIGYLGQQKLGGGRSRRSSRRISSRGRSSRPSARPSAWYRAFRASAGSRSPSPAARATPARHR